MAMTDRAGEAFLRALDEARRSTPAGIESRPHPSMPEAPVSVGFSSGQGGGGARWDLADAMDQGIGSAARAACV